METNVPKRRDNKKSLRVKVISLGNAEVGKVGDRQLILDQTPYWIQLILVQLLWAAIDITNRLIFRASDQYMYVKHVD